MTDGVRRLVGISPAQLGRLFGVPTRVARGWLCDLPMPEHHQSRLAHLVSVWPSGDEYQARAALFASADGQSLYHQLCAELEGSQQLQCPAVSPRVQLGG